MNPYAIILILFTLAGVAMMIWGWLIIARARRMTGWPNVEGVVEKSPSPEGEDGIERQIDIRYTVAGREFLHHLDITPAPAMSPDAEVENVDRYPAGAKIKIYYNPDSPEQATVELGLAHDSWLIFILGLGAATMGAAFLLFNG